MSTAKMIAVGLVVCAIAATPAQADTLLWNGGPGIWMFWVSGGDLQRATDSSSTYSTPQPPSQGSTASPADINTPPPFSSSLSSISASPASGGSSSSGTADAFINFGNGPFPEASSLTTGGAQPWYTSPVVEKLFGGQQPNAQQQLDFENAVLKDVETTYQLSGLSPKITIDPNVHANHTLSVVSNTSYGPNPSAIGITDVGASGFGFIDKLQYAQNLDQLEWAVAHNVSHELMHAFGVAVHHDQTGQYLDAATASWDVLTNPTATFSPAAVQDILSRNFTPIPPGSFGAEGIDGDLEILASPVPEPSTVALWGLAASLLALGRRGNRRDRPR